MRTMILICVWLAIFFLVTTGLAKDEFCDGSVRPDTEAPSDRQYQPRDKNRCEGVYSADHSLEERIYLVSLETLNRSDLGTIEVLDLCWKTRTDADRVWIQANSIEPGIYYRMDTYEKPGEGRFSWDLKHLNRAPVPVETMGILAWVMRNIEREERPLFLPLTSQAEKDSCSSKVKGILYSLVQLDSLNCAVERIEGSSMDSMAKTTEDTFQRTVDVSFNKFDSIDSPIPFLMDVGPEGSMFRLIVNAYYGGSSELKLTREFYFEYYPRGTVDLFSED